VERVYKRPDIVIIEDDAPEISRGILAFSFCDAIVWFHDDAVNTAYSSIDCALFDKEKKAVIRHPESGNDAA
jgi:hypothetical protein